MDGLFGVIIALVITVVTIAAKAKEQSGRQGRRPRQQWPGPVAGGPMMPGFPRPPARPPAPTPPQRQQPRMQPAAPSPARNGNGYDGEGVSMEGVGTEGPKPDENVFTEMGRFQREIAQDIDVNRDVPVDEDIKPDKNLRPLEIQPMQLTTTLAYDAEALQAARVAQDDATVSIDDLMASRGNLAQAIVLAEVLGKPKALRRRGFGGR